MVGLSVVSWGLVYVDLSQIPFDVIHADNQLVRDDASALFYLC